MVSTTQNLRKLTSAPATAAHQEEFNKQTNAKADDRGLCLLITAQIENELDRALDYELGKQADDLHEELFSQGGPLGTFARKITIAAALETIGPVTRENLRLIRHIRNAFAHAKVPITFQTPEVAAACAELQRINIFDPPEQVDQQSPTLSRARFEIVCAETMIRLTRYTGHEVQFTKDDGKPAATLREKLP